MVVHSRGFIVPTTTCVFREGQVQQPHRRGAYNTCSLLVRDAFSFCFEPITHTHRTHRTHRTHLTQSAVVVTTTRRRRSGVEWIGATLALLDGSKSMTTSCSIWCIVLSVVCITTITTTSPLWLWNECCSAAGE
jgi:hypothetical protein